MSCISIDVSRIGTPLECAVSRIGTPLNVSCGLVCTTVDHFYLRVVQDVIWLIPDEALVDVESNTTWYIE